MINNIQKKITFGVLFLLLLFSCFSFSSAQNNTDQNLCFLKLQIKETLKNYDQVIKAPETKMDVAFSLISQENYYGKEYPLDEYNADQSAGNYILNVYDGQNNIIKKYSVPTSLIISDFSGSGELLKEAIINAAIPYGSGIKKIAISNNGVETDLKINPSLIKCERTCKIENEKGNYKADSCCIGFIPATQNKGALDGSFVCVKCGDKICSQYEDKYSCPEDCSPKPVPPAALKNPETNKKYNANSMLLFAAAAALVLVIILGIIIFIIIKKRNSFQLPQ